MCIEEIREFCNQSKIRWSQHCLSRMQERDIITAYIPNNIKFSDDLKTRRY